MKIDEDQTTLCKKEKEEEKDGLLFRTSTAFSLGTFFSVKSARLPRRSASLVYTLLSKREAKLAPRCSTD